jgi:hypothetical protein
MAEKSRHGLGARVETTQMKEKRMIQTLWHFWCRALFYSCMVSLLGVWLALVLCSVIFIPMMMFFSDPPETLLGKMHLGGFCVSLSFLMLALFVMCPFGMMKDDFAPASCRNNVIASIAQKISKVLATAGFHILAVVGVVLVVRTFMMIWARG